MWAQMVIQSAVGPKCVVRVWVMTKLINVIIHCACMYHPLGCRGVTIDGVPVLLHLFVLLFGLCNSKWMVGVDKDKVLKISSCRIFRIAILTLFFSHGNFEIVYQFNAVK